jgi:subtilisin family serine protease
MTSKKFIASLSSAVLAASFVVGLAIVNSASAANPNCVEQDGDYIVSFKPGASVDREINSVPGQKINPKFKYDLVFKGFAGTLKAEQVCAFKRNPNVVEVEMDGIVEISGEQINPTWGLDRIDQRNLPLDFKYNYFDTATASNVNAYVIDTGILASNVDFESRVTPGHFEILDGKGSSDCNGHGTHVAGTIGAKTYGVAKQVNLVPVRVLDCKGSGSNSGVIAGVNWVISDASSKSATHAAVANMSLGGGFSTALNTAVAALVQSGVVVVVAAGNSKRDACKFSPASTTSAVTVGATQSNDARASYSNYGTCLDIFAPGTNIESTWITASNSTKTISGTSMASPHVAGVVALYLSTNSSASPIEVDTMLRQNSTLGKVASAGTGSPNRLLAAPTAK